MLRLNAPSPCQDPGSPGGWLESARGPVPQRSAMLYLFYLTLVSPKSPKAALWSHISPIAPILVCAGRRGRRSELGAVVYDQNVLGFNGPRLMKGEHWLGCIWLLEAIKVDYNVVIVRCPNYLWGTVYSNSWQYILLSPNVCDNLHKMLLHWPPRYYCGWLLIHHQYCVSSSVLLPAVTPGKESGLVELEPSSDGDGLIERFSLGE